MDNVLAFILGGGIGSRLYPLTKFRSKPAVPLGGKYRLVDIPVSNCINSNILKIYVVTQFNSESLNRSVFQTYKFDIFSRGYIRVLTAEQSLDREGWFQGTADAVRKNVRHITDRDLDYVLILSGDQLYRMDYKKLVKEHIASGADATLALTLTPARKAPELGLARINENKEIISFVEKPKDPNVIKDFCIPPEVKAEKDRNGNGDYVLANMGIYVFSKKYLRELMESTTEQDFGKGIFPSLLGQKKLMGYIHEGYWEDIGTIKAFYEANLDLASPLPKFNLYDMDYPIYAQPLFLPPSKLEACNIKNSLISDGCLINRAYINHSIIGIRSMISKDTHIENSIIMGADSYEPEKRGRPNEVPLGIGRNCLIRKAIIDKHVYIGDNVKIINPQNHYNFTGPNYEIKDGIIVVEKEAVIPDGTII
ncbi:MAG: glucose-1-phosphate adenylyltransferase [Candidatus Margulisiibacteriota bacterium]|jgi:glucose-1-phosphate adenylyltransferase